VAERHRLAPGEDVELTVTVRPDGSSPLGLAQYDVSLETVEGTLMPLTIEPATVAHRQIVTEAGDSARFRLHAVRPGTAVVSVLVAAGFQRWDPNASSLYFALIWGTTRSQPIEVVQPGG
jgi:hypothetical protein